MRVYDKFPTGDLSHNLHSRNFFELGCFEVHLAVGQRLFPIGHSRELLCLRVFLSA